MKHKEENRLLTAAALGNEAAFAELYDHYSGGVETFIKRYLKSNQLSEDICQNVFVKIWEQRAQLSAVLEFNAFAFTIAKRQSLDFLKRAAIEQNALGIIISGYEHNSNQVEDWVKDQEYALFITDVLSRLPEQTRIIFNLCRQERKTYDEAAELLGISRSAIRKHMIRAMKVMGKAAENELGIPLSVLLIWLSSR